MTKYLGLIESSRPQQLRGCNLLRSIESISIILNLAFTFDIRNYSMSILKIFVIKKLFETKEYYVLSSKRKRNLTKEFNRMHQSGLIVIFGKLRMEESIGILSRLARTSTSDFRGCAG